MTDLLGAFQKCVAFLENMEVGGLSMITWMVIVVIISGIGFILRGNKE